MKRSTRKPTTQPGRSAPHDDFPRGAHAKLQILRNAAVVSPLIPIAAAEALIILIEAIAADLGVALVRTEEKGGAR